VVLGLKFTLLINIPKFFGASSRVNNMILFSLVNFQNHVLRAANKHTKIFSALRVEKVIFFGGFLTQKLRGLFVLELIPDFKI
jgi:hypothetical protein